MVLIGETKTPPTEGVPEKLSNSSAEQTTIKVMSQRYNKLHVLHRKKKKLPKEVILVSKEVTSLCAIIPNIYLKNCSFGNPTSTT